jgi:hypothetical protein
MIGEKLKILRDSNVIDEETEQFVLSVNHYLLTRKVIDEEEHLDMFLTHLAMANMRQKKNETPLIMDEDILSEIKKDQKLAESKALWQELAQYSSTVFSTDELWFVYMHIINLLNKKK